MTPQELARLRLVAQRLVGERAATPVEAVRHLLCAQGQDLPGALGSVALRTAGGTRAAVAAALDAGEVVRSWPMRGTLHLVAAEDLGWLLALCAGRVVRADGRRQTELGLDAAQVEHAREVALAEVHDGPRTRAQLTEAFETAGLAPGGQRGYHLLATLAMTGSLIQGPMAGREQLWVPMETWVPTPRPLEGDEALGELARRYFHSHGPATDRDLARWSGLPLGPVRTGIAVAAPHLATVEVDGVAHHADPAVLEQPLPRGGVLALPGFDELVLGYADRSCTIGAEDFERIVPGGNGVFRPTVVADGQVVGTWRADGTAEPFTSFRPAVARALPRAMAAAQA